MELHFNNFAAAGRHMPAHIGRFNRKFTMTAIDEDRELNSPRTPMIEQRIECSSDSTTGVKHIVAKNYVSAFHFAAKRTGSHHRPNICRGKIVAIKLDVERASVHRTLFNSSDQFAQPLS